MTQWRDAVGAALLILMAALLNYPGLATASSRSESSLWHALLALLVPGENFIPLRSASYQAPSAAPTEESHGQAPAAVNAAQAPVASPVPEFAAVVMPVTAEAAVPASTPSAGTFVLASIAPAADVAPAFPAIGAAVPLPPLHRPATKLAAEAGCNGGQRIISAYYWEGRHTASGQPFNPLGMTAAHRTLPFGTHLTVSNPRTGKTVTVVINDRGPYAHGVSLDLSLGAAQAIGLRGTGSVCVLSG